MKSRRNALIPLVLGITAVFVAGCGSGAEGGNESSSGTTTAFTAKPQGGIPGALLSNELKLWKYDFNTGKYEVVPGDASKPYVPKIKDFPAGTKIGYIDPWAANTFSIPIREGVEELGKKYGFQVVYCDAAFKPEKAVECAEEVASQNPNFVVAGNWQIGAAPAMMKVLDDAHIPANSIDISEPNAIFVGANNYDAGTIAGKAAGEFAKEEWSCEDIWLLLGDNLAEGEAPDLRLQGFADGVQEVCGRLPSEQINRVRLAAATTDQALTVTTDWLTAHPQAKHVLGVSLDDERGSGMARSFAQDTETEGYASGMGCDSVGVELMRQAPPEQNHFLGCPAFFGEKYPELLISTAQDVLEEKPVPNEVHVEHKWVDHETVNQYFPK